MITQPQLYCASCLCMEYRRLQVYVHMYMEAKLEMIRCKNLIYMKIIPIRKTIFTMCIYIHLTSTGRLINISAEYQPYTTWNCGMAVQCHTKVRQSGIMGCLLLSNAGADRHTVCSDKVQSHNPVAIYSYYLVYSFSEILH